MSRRVTALNQTGIKSLQQGYFSEAICSFRMAIACMNIDASATSSLNMVPMEGSEETELDIQSVRVDRLSMVRVLEVSPHNTFEIYQGMFAFSKPNSLLPHMSEISLMLFFNLGVAHHLAGFSSSLNETQRNLQKALKYYKLALTIFRSNTDLRLNSCCYCIVLGLLTNMGNLFNHFCNIKETEACRKHVESILSSVAIVELADEESEFFMMALTYSQAHTSVAAPAA